MSDFNVSYKQVASKHSLTLNAYDAYVNDVFVGRVRFVRARPSRVNHYTAYEILFRAPKSGGPRASIPVRDYHSITVDNLCYLAQFAIREYVEKHMTSSVSITDLTISKY